MNRYIFAIVVGPFVKYEAEYLVTSCVYLFIYSPKVSLLPKQAEGADAVPLGIYCRKSLQSFAAGTVVPLYHALSALETHRVALPQRMWPRCLRSHDKEPPDSYLKAV